MVEIQIQQYKKEYNYTYNGIGYCLWYITSILNNELELKYGIAKVKYYYEQSKEYYLSQSKISNSLKNISNVDKIKKVDVKISKLNRKTMLYNLDESEDF